MNEALLLAVHLFNIFTFGKSSKKMHVKSLEEGMILWDGKSWILKIIFKVTECIKFPKRASISILTCYLEKHALKDSLH
jgi:hypothetical protein